MQINIFIDKGITDLALGLIIGTIIFYNILVSIFSYKSFTKSNKDWNNAVKPVLNGRGKNKNTRFSFILHDMIFHFPTKFFLGFNSILFMSLFFWFNNNLFLLMYDILVVGMLFIVLKERTRKYQDW